MAGMISYNRRPGAGLRTVFPFDMLGDLISEEMDVPATFVMDVEDTDDAYKITAHLPGVARDEIGVELREGRLSIAVNKKETEEEKNKNFLHKETREWSATRGVYLKDAASEGVEAKLEDGILTITVPKLEEKKNITKVEIQ